MRSRESSISHMNIADDPGRAQARVQANGVTRWWPRAVARRLGPGWLVDLGVAWLTAVVSLAVVLCLAARSRMEIGESLVFAAIGGTFGFGLIKLGWLALQWTGIRSLRRGWVAGLALLVSSLLMLKVVSIGLDRPFLGLLAVVGASLPWPCWYLTGAERPGRQLGTTLAALVLLTLVATSAPLDSRPTIVDLAPPAADDLAVLTWNVGSAPPKARNGQLRHIPHIADVLIRHQVDIACLQEIPNGAFVDALVAELERREGHWRGHPSRPRGQSVAIVTRLGGRLRSVAGSWLYTGGPVGLEVPELDVEVICAHMPAERSTGGRASYARWLARDARGSGPQMIVGDFNLDPAGFWDRMSSVFSDDLGIDRAIAANLGHGRIDIGATAAATTVFSRRLDRLYVPPAVRAVHYRILRGERRDRMDHRPVLLRCRKERGTTG